MRKEFVERFLLAARRSLTAVVEERAAALGGPPPLPAEDFAIAIAALANGLAIERLFDRENVPEDLLVRVIEKLAA